MSIGSGRCQVSKLPSEAVGRAVREYLNMLDDAAFGGATPVTPKRINLTAPAARWTAATREAACYAYSTNYLINLDHAVIVDVEGTTSVRQAKVTAQRRMIERLQQRFGVWPERLVADAAYGSAPNLLGWSKTMSIEPHIRCLTSPPETMAASSAPTSFMTMHVHAVVARRSDRETC